MPKTEDTLGIPERFLSYNNRVDHVRLLIFNSSGATLISVSLTKIYGKTKK